MSSGGSYMEAVTFNIFNTFNTITSYFKQMERYVLTLLPRRGEWLHITGKPQRKLQVCCLIKVWRLEHGHMGAGICWWSIKAEFEKKKTKQQHQKSKLRLQICCDQVTLLSRSITEEQCESERFCWQVLCRTCYVTVPCRRATFQHADFQLTGSLEGLWCPQLPPAAASAISRVAGHLHGMKLAQHNKSLHTTLWGERVAFFLPPSVFFFWRGGWVCSWAAGTPEQSDVPQKTC